MNRRKLSPALGPQDVRMLSDAAHAAEFLGQPFTALVTIHFGLLTPSPADPSEFLRRDVINRLGVWFRRHGMTWTALWVRENFAGPNREHVHLLVHVPLRLRPAFQSAVRRWWPDENAADVRPAGDVKRAVRYLSKQLSPQAHFAVRRRIGRQSVCPRTGARVAPVLGRRFSMTRNLKTQIRGSIPA